jgi:hypothetical protein
MQDVYELVKQGALSAKAKANEARKLEKAAQKRVDQYKVLQWLIRCGFTVAYDVNTHSVRASISLFDEAALNALAPNLPQGDLSEPKPS